MQAFRLFFVLLATCIGFVMVVGTIIGLGFGILEIFEIRPYNTAAYITIFGGLVLCFLAFMRVVSRVVTDVTKGFEHKGERTANADETRVMQDLHQGMVRMTQRVESLETILLDRAPSSRHEDSARY
jgi:phage shock protein B